MKNFFELESTSESLDDDAFCEIFGSRKKADFLLNNRKIIAEIKTINASPNQRLNLRLKEWLSRPDAPIVFGQFNVGAVLDSFSDSDQLKKEWFDVSARSVRQSIGKMCGQITSTKKQLSINDSSGLGVLINEFEKGIYIQGALHGIRHCLSLRDEYEHVRYVWVVIESHRLNIPGFGEVFPFALVTRENAPPDDDEYFLKMMILEWARFNRSDLIEIDHQGLWDVMSPVFEDGPVVLDPFE
ncbi:MAG: hypothetical protein ACXIVO_00885 [Glycocaulis sp.]